MPIPDLTNYNKKSTKGLAYARNTGDSKLFAVVTRKFDPADGTEIDAEVTGVYLKEVDEALAEAQTRLDELKAFRAELIAAKTMEVSKTK